MRFSAESHLLLDWDGETPRLLWEVMKGEGYSSPAIFRGHPGHVSQASWARNNRRSRF